MVEKVKWTVDAISHLKDITSINIEDISQLKTTTDSYADPTEHLNSFKETIIGKTSQQILNTNNALTIIELERFKTEQESIINTNISNNIATLNNFKTEQEYINIVNNTDILTLNNLKSEQLSLINNNTITIGELTNLNFRDIQETFNTNVTNSITRINTKIDLIDNSTTYLNDFHSSSHVNISGNLNLLGDLTLNCNDISGVTDITFCDGTYINSSLNSNINTIATFNIPKNSLTNTIQSVNCRENITIHEDNIIARLDNPANMEQVYTFGPTIPNRWVAVGDGENTISYSNDGFNWFGLGKQIFSKGRGVEWNGNMWVAVGDGTNNIAFSYDGRHWNSNYLFNGGSANGVVWNGKMWIITGDLNNGGSSSSIIYSYNGIEWFATPNNIFSINCNNAAWNGKMWIAVGEGTHTIAYSYNGIDWTGLGNSLFSISGNGVNWNGTMWVAVGSGETNSIAYSYDGINWTGLGKNMLTIGYGIAWNGNVWVTMGSGDINTIAYSYDGVNWIGIGNTIFSDSGYNAKWNGTMWIAVGKGINSIAYSDDGIHWMGQDETNLIFNISGHDIAHNNLKSNTITFKPKIMLAGGDGDRIFYSYNGKNWTQHDVNLWNYVWDLEYNGKMWIAMTRGVNTISYSYDGLNWIGLGNSIFSDDGYGVAWNGKMWVGVGSLGRDKNNKLLGPIHYSYDGINWIESNNGLDIFPDRVKGIAWNGTMWIAVGGFLPSWPSDRPIEEFATLAYSYDGINWTRVPNSKDILPYVGHTVKWNGQMWVAGGNSDGKGAILAYSYNGIEWYSSTFRSNIWNQYVLAFATNGTIWVCGFSGGIAISNDGITWNTVALDPNVHRMVDDIIYTGTMFIALTVSGTDGIMYSYDGKKWISLGILFGRGRWLDGHGRCIGYDYTGFPAIKMGNEYYGNTLIYNKLNPSGIPVQAMRAQATRRFTIHPYRIVAVGYGNQKPVIAYSSDGRHWEKVLPNTVEWFDLTGVATNGNEWVAVGLQDSNVFYSKNGVHWNKEDITRRNRYGVATNGRLWLAPGAAQDGSIPYSYDGKKWTELGSNNRLIFNISCISVAWNGTMWVAVGHGTNTIAYSYDGITWIGLGNSIFSVSAHGIAWDGKMWVAVGQGTNSIAYSYNGINWTGVGDILFSRGEFIATNASMWIAVGTGTNTIAYSYDGINWTGLGNSIFSSSGYGVTWTGSRWAAVGSGTHTIAHSDNGIIWTGNTQNIFESVGRSVSWSGAVSGIKINNDVDNTDKTNLFVLNDTDKSELNSIDIVNSSYYQSGFNNFSLSITGSS